MILPSYPFRVEVEITSACNLNCLYCYAKGIGTEPQNMENIEFVLDKTKAEADPFELVVLGGEPFMRDDLLNILESAMSKSFTSLGLSTNGTLLTKQSLEQIGRLKNLVDRGLGLQVSLDSTAPNINDATRGMGKATLDGIKLLEKNKIAFSVGIVVTKANYVDIKHSVNDLLQYESLVSINLEVLEPSQAIDQETYASLNIRRAEKEYLYKEVSCLVAEKSDREIPVLGIKPSITCIDTEPLLNTYNFKACTAGLLKAGILTNGDVIPCVNLRFSKLGNIYKQSWSEIWSDAQKRFLRLNLSGPQCISGTLRREEVQKQKCKSI